MKNNASNIQSTFLKIKELAQSNWEKFYDGSTPIITVGTATCGVSSGALETLDALNDQLKKEHIKAHVIEVGCMGHCYGEPMVTISKPGFPPIAYVYVTPDIARRLIKDFLVGDDFSPEFMLGALEVNDIIPSISDLPRFSIEKPLILRNIGRINPEDIFHYISHNGYEALAISLQKEQRDIIDIIKQSGLRGRGGAGFSTGIKWETCFNAQEDTRYIICNADEGDPGAFMDRAILESDPHSIIEGMIIAGYALGAKTGYIYVRAEYPLAVKRIKTALIQASNHGLIGNNILGSGFSFDIIIFQGSGAFVCGEETALIESLEGKPGLPKHRPPFPATHGLYGKPTVIDNVKTLAYVPLIIKNGAQWFSAIGSEGSKGTAVFTLAGKIVNTGLIEVPMGTKLREIIFDVGGGIPKGKIFKAVQIGGPSGGCLPESMLDTPIEFDSLKKAGSMMGSGGMVILDENDCMVEVARYFLEFTQRESCGKCTMCRLGTKHMLDILNDITQGKGKIENVETLLELANDVKAGSLCNLGKTAPNPILTALKYFRDEFEVHIKESRCPSLMCRDLISYYILPEKCERSCDACVGTCTVEAIYSNKKRIKVIDQEKCVKCNTCIDSCPPQYNAIVKLSPPLPIPVTKDSK